MIICLGPYLRAVLPNERDFRFDRFRRASVRLRLLLRKCLFLLEHFVSFLCKHDHREEHAGVDRNEDADAHQQRRHTTGPLGVRVTLTIRATLKSYWIPGTGRKWPFTNE